MNGYTLANMHDHEMFFFRQIVAYLSFDQDWQNHMSDFKTEH